MKKNLLLTIIICNLLLAPAYAKLPWIPLDIYVSQGANGEFVHNASCPTSTPGYCLYISLGKVHNTDSGILRDPTYLQTIYNYGIKAVSLVMGDGNWQPSITLPETSHVGSIFLFKNNATNSVRIKYKDQKDQVWKNLQVDNYGYFIVAEKKNVGWLIEATFYKPSNEKNDLSRSRGLLLEDLLIDGVNNIDIEMKNSEWQKEVYLPTLALDGNFIHLTSNADLPITIKGASLDKDITVSRGQDVILQYSSGKWLQAHITHQPSTGSKLMTVNFQEDLEKNMHVCNVRNSFGPFSYSYLSNKAACGSL